MTVSIYDQRSQNFCDLGSLKEGDAFLSDCDLIYSVRSRQPGQRIECLCLSSVTIEPGVNPVTYFDENKQVRPVNVKIVIY